MSTVISFCNIVHFVISLFLFLGIFFVIFLWFFYLLMFRYNIDEQWRDSCYFTHFSSLGIVNAHHIYQCISSIVAIDIDCTHVHNIEHYTHDMSCCYVTIIVY